jgi:Amt family ammonium transporter
MDSGDTAWILVATALVMLMTPGVGLFYAGMVRRKNAIAMIALSLVCLIVVSIQWVIYGYSLAFGSDIAGFVGDLSYVLLNNVGLKPAEGMTIPHLLFMIYQMMFAVITLAILTSAVAERVKLSAFIIFGILWITLVYEPFAHWLWGGGWLAQLGALDFAGGIVVHVSSGFAALALAFVVGRRAGLGEYPMEPHNIPMTLLGTALLWFGWFGFNGGSALAANGLAANAIVVTNTAAAVAGAVWMVIGWMKSKPSSLGIASGAIAGLAAITPAAGFVDVKGAIIIGLVAGIICYLAMDFRIRRGIDESLDAWAIHGIGGLWGSIAVGIFATTSVNEYAGLIHGNVALLKAQLIAVIASVAYAFVVSYVLAKIVDALIGLRVSDEEEYVGLDISQHGEVAYT